MKPAETIGHLEVRNLLAIGVCCFLAVFIGGMLTREYISRDRMFQDHIHALDQSLEKRASAVSYFFSERLADLDHLGSARELNGYFENMALGMSMRYGLKSSLFAAARRFFMLLKTKHINGEPIYSRLLYVTQEGEILIDTKGAPDDFPPFFADLLVPGEKKERIIGDGTTVAVSLPFYFKKRVAGRLISMIEVDTIDRHLVRQSVDAGGFYCLNLTAVPFDLGGKVPLRLAGSDQLPPSWFEGRPYRIVEGAWTDILNARVLVMRAKVAGTPFSIISMSQSDTMSGTSVFAIMTAFVLFIGTGIFFIWRTATQRLIVGVRLQASRQSEQHFRDLVEFLPLPVGEYGFDLKMKYANREAKIFFGYTQADIDAGVSVTELVQEKDLPQAMARMAKLQAGENPGPIKINARCRDGRKIYGKAIPSLVYENGAISGVRTCFIDMTQQLKSEKETRIAAEQEKYALVGQVAGKMAHDFNNILGAIMGNADLALLDCKDKEMQNTFEIILEQSKRGNILTRNLVAFAKDQEIKEEYFNINQKLDLVLNLLKKELDGITVIKNYQKNPPELLADPGMIEHALVNLIQNAIHAMGKTEHPALGLDTRSADNRLFITIRDNGCGIPDAYAKDIYSPSFTLKGSRDLVRAYLPDIRGTGYGLSNVKKYIDKHKGSIEFISQEDKGTRFVISLPVVAKTLLDVEKDEMMKKPVVRRRRILVVEDEPAISMVLEKILTSEPFYHTVRLATDGVSAIEIIDCEPFDLVSLDYMLPGRINGLDVYTHIRRTKSQLPVVFISGNIRFLESMKTLQASDTYLDHLSKPFENLVYADKINHWLQLDHQ